MQTLPRATVSAHMPWCFLWERKCSCRIDPHGVVPLPTQLQWHLTVHQVSGIFHHWPSDSGDSSLLSSSSEQEFLIAVWICFPFISIYVPLPQHVCWTDKGDEAFPLTVYHCWLYLLLCITFTSRLQRLLFLTHSPPNPLFAPSGFEITLYTTFYHLFTFIFSAVHFHHLLPESNA